MNYIELHCKCKNNSEEIISILIAELDELEYDSFKEGDDGLYAYIQEEKFDLKKVESLNLVRKKLLGEIEFKFELFREKNWNEHWEKNFQPVNINDILNVRAPFHKTDKKFRYEIVLEPKMSFGTGHHASTWLMLSGMIDIDFNGKKVLDIGCGTGILSIFAKKLNAKEIIAIDNNHWAFENANENIVLNSASEIQVLNGDINLLTERDKFDIILANINRNVILDEMINYVKHIKENGVILFSGILSGDFNEINKMASKLELSLILNETKDNWLLLKYSK